MPAQRLKIGQWFRIGLLLALSPGSSALAQPGWDIDDTRPKVAAKPAKATEAEEKHYRALKLYVKGRLLEQDRRYVDAIKTLEAAARLEPDAAAIYKAIVPLCYKLDRPEQAVDYSKKALDLDPNDYQLRWRLAVELREQGKSADAHEQFTKTLTSKELRKHPGDHAEILMTTARLGEELNKPLDAVKCYSQLVSLLKKRQESLAKTNADLCRQITEDIGMVLERWGRAESQAGRFDQAIAAFQQAQKEDPDRVDRLSLALAELYARKQDPDRALQHLGMYLLSQPTDGEAYGLLVKLLTQLKRGDEVVPMLEKYAKTNRTNQPLKLLLANEYVKAGKAKEGEKTYLAILAEEPIAEAYLGWAKLLQAQKRWTELVDRFDQDATDPKRIAVARMQTEVLLAEPELAKGLAEAAKARPKDQPLDLRTRKQLAVICRQARHFDLAEHFCRACIADETEPSESYIELCRVLSEAGKFDAEADVCREALGKPLTVSKLVFQLELARALSHCGKAKEAVAAAQEPLKNLKPGNFDHFRASLTLASVYLRGNELDSAAKQCRDLLAFYDGAAEQRQARYLLSSVYSAQHDYVKAEELLEKLLAADPEDAAVAGDLGWVLFKRGKLDEAREQLERGSKLPHGDTDPDLWDHLGDVYLALKETTKARAAWEKALQLHKTTPRPGWDQRAKEIAKKLK